MNHPVKARQTLGKYRIQRRIGEGGFSTVYEALDTVEGVRVAVKIPQGSFQSTDALEWFRREARMQAGLDHPNILPVKNAELIDGKFLIVYPLGDGSLADRMRRRLSTLKALEFGEQMLRAVAYAHGRKVIHCDLKPENFILFPEDRLRLADFSVSKVSVRTVLGSGSGTLGYMAPEQAMGRASFRADVFALGLIFNKMLTGVLPEWPFEWPPKGYDKVRRKVHPDLIEWIRRAIQVDPRRRFRDAQQMLAAFHKIKPRALRFVHGEVRRRAPPRATPSTAQWKVVRQRSFLKQYREAAGAHLHCARCEGPLAEGMEWCPWCRHRVKPARQDTTFPARCPRCKRGRKLDWNFCAFCFGPAFRSVSPRSFSDSRYSARCAGPSCRGPLMPFLRYCPWCRRKVRRGWKIAGSPDSCSRCGWGVIREYWDLCPWCGHRLDRK